jgi:hypothetical protein
MRLELEEEFGFDKVCDESAWRQAGISMGMLWHFRAAA